MRERRFTPRVCTRDYAGTFAPVARPSSSEAPMDVRFEQGADLATRGRTDALPAIILPLESSVIELRISGAVHRLDRSTFAVVPARLSYRLTAVSPVTKVLTLLVGDGSRALACREYKPHIDPTKLGAVLGETRIFGRTRWFEELAHRYLFERDTCEKHTSRAARFLETEMTKEVYFLGQELIGEHTRASVVHEGSDVVRRARQWIEDHLFLPLRMDELARRCHTSESTLLRAFKSELGMAPTTYVRDRRLDEALLLLESGRFAVGEVASRVGYGNLPAFTVAFGRRFGAPPSTMRFSPPASPALPPHGAPPKKPSKRRTRRSL